MRAPPRVAVVHPLPQLPHLPDKKSPPATRRVTQNPTSVGPEPDRPRLVVHSSAFSSPGDPEPERFPHQCVVREPHLAVGVTWFLSARRPFCTSLARRSVMWTMEDVVRRILVLLLVCSQSSGATHAPERVTRPVFVDLVANVTVAVGRDAALQCVVDHLNNHQVAWVHMDRQMIVAVHRKVVTRIPRFSVSHDHQRTWLLHIRDAQPEDAGGYMCQVNTDPMLSQIGYVHVVVPPSISDADSSPSHVSVREGSRVTLTCRGRGDPDPRITWKREDSRPLNEGRVPNDSLQSKLVLSADGEELTFLKVSRTDSGAYLCIAINGVPPSVSKRIILDVEFEPMMHVANQLIGSPLGDNVSLECVTEAHPRPITYWVQSNGSSSHSVMMHPSKRIRINTHHSAYKARMTLEIHSLRLHDMGNYKCVSKNSLGEAEGSIRVYEIIMTLPPTKHIETRPSSLEVGTSTVAADKENHRDSKRTDGHRSGQTQPTLIRHKSRADQQQHGPAGSKSDADRRGPNNELIETRNSRPNNQGRTSRDPWSIRIEMTFSLLLYLWSR